MGEASSRSKKPDLQRDAIYRELLQAGYRFAIYRRVWPEDAEDVAAEALAKFHRVYGDRLFRLESPKSLYFYVLRSCMADAARKRKPMTAQPEPTSISVHPRHQQRLDAQSLLAELPDDEQEAILLLYFEGMTYPEAAKVTARSLDSLKHLRKKAMQRLRDRLGISLENEA